MAQVRRVLAPLTAIWLLWQVGTVTLVPAALSIRTADPHAADCTCVHGPGVTCPMHHKRAGDSTQCAMQAATSSGTAVLTTLVGTAGLVPEPSPSVQPPASSEYPRAADVHIVGERPVPPDPPPPRV